MYRYALLGLVQGLTEFLPISSSGHLLLAQHLLGVDPPGLALEGVVHLATMAAVVIYFRGELWRLVAGALRGRAERRYLGLLVVAALPAGGAGWLLKSQLEWAFSSLSLTGAMFLLTAGVLSLSRLKRGAPQAPSLRHALAVGLSQVVSLFPGASRSGLTISVGILSGLSPREAAQFSFLLSLPLIAGAGAVALAQAPLGEASAPGLGVAGLFAFASGLLAIHVLLRVVVRGRLGAFAIYCVALGGLAFALA